MKRAKAHNVNKALIEVELQSLDQIDEALATGADVLMMDNFSVADLKKGSSVGAVTRIDRSVDVAIFSHPRVSADGTRMAFVANVSSQWYLGIRDVDTQVEWQFHVDGNIATPEWRGHYIYATVMHDGFIGVAGHE